MKTKYYWITGIIFLALFLIANTPATLVVNSINDRIPQVKIQNVSGTLWQGSAQQLTVQSKYVLKNIEWSICVAHLLLAKACVELDAIYDNSPLNGQISIGINKAIQAKNINATITAQTLSQIITLPMGEIDGDISVDLKTLEWQPGGLPSATGIIKWNKASITIAETAQLGDITITLTESEDNPIRAEISNLNGQLNITGTASLKENTDYNLDLTLTPETNASRNLKSSLALFSRANKNGSFTLKNSGNLKQLGMM